MASELSSLISKLKSYQPIGQVRRPIALDFISDYHRFIKVLEDINGLVGLQRAKDQVRRQVKGFIVNCRRYGKPTNKELLHTLIYGPAGCGKTQLGEKLAELWAVSGCLPKDDGVNPFGAQQASQETNSGTINALQMILQTDNEKTSLKQSIILKDVQIRQLREQIRTMAGNVSNILTQFNNVRKKVRAKIDKNEPKIQGKFQEVKEGLRQLLDDSPNSSPSNREVKIEPDILPVTIPKTPGVRSLFGGSQPPLLPQIQKSTDPLLAQLSTFKKPEKKPVKFIRVTRGDLIAKYQGHSTDNVRKLLSKYIGGVIMVDEAYNLLTSKNDDFGKEILTEIINFMTTWPDKIIFIFAGYKADMEETVLKFQQGLNRRFNWTFEISEYTSKELSAIFQRQIHQKYSDHKNLFSEETLKELESFFEKNKDKFPHFGGDTERFCNYLHEILSCQHWEKALDDTMPTDDYNHLFDKVDMKMIDLAFDEFLHNSVKEREEEARKKKEEEEKSKHFGIYS